MNWPGWKISEAEHRASVSVTNGSYAFAPRLSMGMWCFPDHPPVRYLYVSPKICDMDIGSGTDTLTIPNFFILPLGES
jgi:hypothetical protein